MDELVADMDKRYNKTQEELDKSNEHLDSRSQQHYSSYNAGMIAAVKDFKHLIEVKKAKYIGGSE